MTEKAFRQLNIDPEFKNLDSSTSPGGIPATGAESGHGRMPGRYHRME